MTPASPEPFVTSHQPLLGTVVEIRIVGAPAAAAEADRVVVHEIERLEHVFSAFDPTSELCRWRSGEPVATSRELDSLLSVALDWQIASDGAFNPATGELSRLWTLAAESGCLPDDVELATTAARIRAPRYVIDAGAPKRVGDCRALNFNAIAKGFIVDRSIEAGLATSGVESVAVNAGGDLRHAGVGSIVVGIENPTTPYDNAPPLMTIDLSNRSIATSGSSRRGFRVGGRWFSHVLDPRSGRPIEHIRSASAIAADAVTADAVATVVGVTEREFGLALVESLDDVECCLADADGVVWTSSGWARHQRIAM